MIHGDNHNKSILCAHINSQSDQEWMTKRKKTQYSFLPIVYQVMIALNKIQSNHFQIWPSSMPSPQSFITAIFIGVQVHFIYLIGDSNWNCNINHGCWNDGQGIQRQFLIKLRLDLSLTHFWRHPVVIYFSPPQKTKTRAILLNDQKSQPLHSQFHSCGWHFLSHIPLIRSFLT